MKKEKYLVFGVVLTLFLSTMFLSTIFVSCLDDNDDYNNSLFEFIYEPVIIESIDGSTGIKTQYGDMLAPQLKQAKPGEYYLTNFLMDTTYHPHTAYNIQYKQMGADTLHMNMGTYVNTPSTEYNTPISDLKIYLQDANANSLLKTTEVPPVFICIDSTFFVQAIFDNTEKTHDLEFFRYLDPSPTPEIIPTFYVRAKESDMAISKQAYALNFSTWPKSTTAERTKLFQFNLKYKTGVDAEGNEIYKDYRNNPVNLIIKN